MKYIKKFNTIKISLLVCWFLSLPFGEVGGAFAQAYKGKVVNYKTKQPVEYANVGIPNKGYGVTCNENGEFTLKITSESDTDIVKIFSIGYKTQYMQVKQFKAFNVNELMTIALTEQGYELGTVTVRPNEYETMIVGGKDVSEFKCDGKVDFHAEKKDTATIRKNKEKGVSEKGIGLEFGNKIKIDKGQQTFIDKIRFKTCLKPQDTCIYRINIYKEDATLKRHMTPIGMVKEITTINIMKQPVILKVIGKEGVQEIDVSSQNIEVDDDFIIAIECVYTSNNDINLAMKVNMFGSTDLIIRDNTMSEWFKIPLIDATFVSATVTYKKKKGFFARLFD